MIVVRDVFKAKYGRGGDLINHFKEAQTQWDGNYGNRILTDVSGSFFTVITETDVESLGAWEQRINGVFSQPGFGDWFNRMTDLVESGEREFLSVEA